MKNQSEIIQVWIAEYNRKYKMSITEKDIYKSIDLQIMFIVDHPHLKINFKTDEILMDAMEGRR